jgi:hypothetical protein
MDRINANYQTDKDALGNGIPSGERMLARSDSHSVGGAGGSGKAVSQKNIDLLTENIFQDLSSRLNDGV